MLVLAVSTFSIYPCLMYIDPTDDCLLPNAPCLDELLHSGARHSSVALSTEETMMQNINVIINCSSQARSSTSLHSAPVALYAYMMPPYMCHALIICSSLRTGISNWQYMLCL